MPSRKSAIIAAGICALSAVPLLWSLAAEAKSVACSITNTGLIGPGFIAIGFQTFSVECSAEGMMVRGRARLHSSFTGVQVALDGASGTTNAEATVLGYDSGQQFIPGCINTDTTAGPGFKNLFCDNDVKFLTVSASGTAP